MSKVEVDRHLLFGLLALQTGLIDQGALFTAFNIWTRDKARSLADILVDQHVLDAARRALLDGLVVEHLKMHGGDLEKSLAVIEAGPSTREKLAQVNDPALAASIVHVGTKQDRFGSRGAHSLPKTVTPLSEGVPSDRRARLLAEQHDRWKLGERVLVEVFLDREPDLRDHSEALLDLIYNEIVLREQRGETPCPDEYVGRFPNLSAAIKDQFEVHGMFAEQVSSWGDGPADGSSRFSVGTSSSSDLRFRVLRPYAKGGLGAVFVALDTELHREVALKQILDRHADDPTSRRRFLVEAEIAGGLEHPGIVPVYGLGTYANGRPFYAMRFIKGDSLKDAITAFHAERSTNHDPGRLSLGLRKLLRRFVDVCNAIEYAHSRGVLHRDLKPGNIIVGKHGETLVVDWGLAKSVGRPDPTATLDERTLKPTSASGSSETLPGSALGTPAFMSPEQAVGDLNRLGPRSDVYSLGATLFVLLTGRPPFEGDEIAVILEAVRRGNFAAPRTIDPSIDAALEAICLKAMERSPEDRYPSPRALADDIERWMADEPVTAWREPFARRARRWGKRNRTVMTAAAVALVAALVGTVAVLAVQAQANTDLKGANGLLSAANDRERRTNAELMASNERERARFDVALAAIKLFHGEVSEDLLFKEKEFQGLRTKLLRGAADFYGKLEALLKGHADRPSRAALGDAYYELADLTAKIGNKPEALAVHHKSLAARRELASGPGGDATSVLDVAQSLLAVGVLIDETGDTAAALSAYEEAQGLAETLMASKSRSQVVQAALGKSHYAIGNVRAKTYDTSGAMKSYGRAIAIQEELVEENPTVTRYQNELANTHNNVGALQSETGDTEGALRSYRRALAIRQKLADSNPTVTEFFSAVALSHGNIALVQRDLGDTAGALQSYDRGLAIIQKLADANPAVTQFQNDLAWTFGGIAHVRSDTGDMAGALLFYHREVAIEQKLADANPSVTDFQNNLALGQSNVGTAQLQTGDMAGARDSYRRALAIMQKLADADPTVTHFQTDLAMSYSNLGNAQQSSGDHAGALQSYHRALAIKEKLVDANPAVAEFQSDAAWIHQGIGRARSNAGDRDGALQSYRRAVAIQEKAASAGAAVPEFKHRLAISLASLSELLRATGDLAGARANCDRAVTIAEALVRAYPKTVDYRSDLAYSLLGLGAALGMLGDPAGAVLDIRRTVVLFEGLPNRSPDALAMQAEAHARLAAFAGSAGSMLTVSEGRAHADQAMDCLSKAIAGGYRFPEIQTDPGFDALRSRPDFQALMLDGSFPANPFRSD